MSKPSNEDTVRELAARCQEVLSLLLQYEEAFPYAEKEGDDQTAHLAQKAINDVKTMLGAIETPEGRVKRIFDDFSALKMYFAEISFSYSMQAHSIAMIEVSCKMHVDAWEGVNAFRAFLEKK